MSLDVSLKVATPVEKIATGVFVRDNGQTRELSLAEVRQKYPGAEVPAVAESNIVFDANITHNLNRMADEAGIYEALWRPDEVGFTKAAQLIEPLREGLRKLKSERDRFKPLEAPNGWGTYDQFVPWVEAYLKACEENPEADVEVSR